MKHVNQFNGAITRTLTKMGLDSGKVLAACNAWRGGVKANKDADNVKIDVASETKLTGAITKKGQDNRKLTVRDTEKTAVKSLSYSAPGALLALSDALTALTDRHGITLEVTELPVDVVNWLDRETFRPETEKAKGTEKEASAKEVKA